MKKIIIAFLLVIFSINDIAYSIHDYNPLGTWKANTGLSMMVGAAFNVRKIPGGYAFYCVAGAICYEIVNQDVFINEWVGGFDNMEMMGDEITIIAEQ
jgi:hypothetical protein